LSGHAEGLAVYLGTFAEALAAAGVEHLCLCPGSRSTPLALTFARHGKLRLWVHLDERSCAYFALGLAKATRRPVALLCTSGTAAVNFAPAVVEASQGRVPLIVLTADRPPELRDLGANQTIDQSRGLYGTATKWFAEMLIPEATDAAVRHAQLVAARAVAASLEGAEGPVHLNFPLREPLVPAELTPREAATHLPVMRSVHSPAADDLAPLAQAASVEQRGLIVCGPQDDPEFPDAVLSLAGALRWPVLADPLSQVRGAAHNGTTVIATYDNFLRDPAVSARFAPGLVLRFGAQPVSKPLFTYLDRQREGSRQVVITPDASWRDPDFTAHEFIHADATAFCRVLAGCINETVDNDPWRQAWQQAEDATSRALDAALAGEASVSEAGVFYHLQRVIPEGATVWAGNSMPVRDLDGFFGSKGPPVRLFANRGASGIDGVVSSALGVAAARQGRVVLVIGDLSFYHDMNGLIAAKRFGLDATIVLVNNDGGGIFSFLPQHDDATHYETLFGTPHGLDFAPVAQLYDLAWQRATTPAGYMRALQASFARPGVSVVEVKTDREENLRAHQAIWRDVAAAVKGSMS
jgi:2-succinyl-5-enolpyruvyl-6-hydroxy-3-cyclohexene-1-carboxylate synthase